MQGKSGRSRLLLKCAALCSPQLTPLSFPFKSHVISKSNHRAKNHLTYIQKQDTFKTENDLQCFFSTTKRLNSNFFSILIFNKTSQPSPASWQLAMLTNTNFHKWVLLWSWRVMQVIRTGTGGGSTQLCKMQSFLACLQQSIQECAGEKEKRVEQDSVICLRWHTHLRGAGTADHIAST